MKNKKKYIVTFRDSLNLITRIIFPVKLEKRYLEDDCIESFHLGRYIL